MIFLFRTRPRPVTPEIDKIHREFRFIRQSLHMWRFNRPYKIDEGRFTIKARIGFDDSTPLDNCPFLAKVGINTKPEDFRHRFVGFAYSDEKHWTEIETWAKGFPFAELIVGLTATGRSKPDSLVILLKKAGNV